MLKGLLKVTAAAAAGYALKSKIITPGAAVSRAANAVKVKTEAQTNYDNGVALTPPMGWSSWNLFRNKINEELILQTAKAMVDSGLAAAGYTYINLDDCWQSSARDENGRMMGDMTNFPRGIKALVDDINALGLKVGIYSSNGTHTCEDLPASLGHEAVDARTFADWGIEYFKYDFCHNHPITTAAPNIEKITLGEIGGNDFICYHACEAELSGHARIATNAPFRDGDYITGLSGGNGAATFTVKVEESKDYVLTVGLRKFGPFYKYCRVIVNDSDSYELEVAPSMGLTPDGRQQLIIALNAGENTIRFHNPITSRMDGAAAQYINMGKELKKATKAVAEETGKPEKPICYSICEWGFNRPWKWGREAGNLWRTTMDIKPFWASVVGIYEINVKLAKYAGPGGWNDPDMLEVGNGDLTEEENRSHFSLWCMMAAPLILGNDLRSFVKADGTPDLDDPTLKILTNRDLLAIDQDPLGIQCRRHKTTIKVDTLVKPLSGGDLAICLFNKFGEAEEEFVSIRELLETEYCGLPEAQLYEVTELWSGEQYDTPDDVSAMIPPHGVKVYRVKAKEIAE